MSQALSIFGDILILVGSVFLFLGALGILRLPDVYNRLQAGTKATTLGSIGLIIGIGFIEPSWFPKMLVIATFIMVGNPISSHALARASYKNGVPLWENSTVDALKKEEKSADDDSETPVSPEGAAS